MYPVNGDAKTSETGAPTLNVWDEGEPIAVAELELVADVDAFTDTDSALAG